MNILSLIQQQADYTTKWIEKSSITKKQYVSLSVAAAITYFVWKQCSRNRRTDIDPTLLPPKVEGGLPIVGNLLDLQKNPRQYLNDARKNFGPCFRLYLPGLGNTVVVTGTLIQEVMKATKNFSFDEGIENLIPAEKVVRISYGHKFKKEAISPRAKNPIIYPIKHNFKENQIDVFSERIRYALDKALDEELNIKPGDEQAVDIKDKLAYIISRISCLCFAGSKVGVNEELITGMAHFTQKIIRAGLFISYLPSWLSRFLVRWIFSVEQEMDVIMALLVPELRKIRNGEMGDDYEATFATMALNLPKEDGTLRKVEDAAYYFNNIALASIHTTSHFASFAFHELACRPQLVEDLRAELHTLQGDMTPETVAKLPLMDSFFREVLRCNPDYLGLHHLTLKDSTLSTGHVVPKGYFVLLALDQVQQDMHFLPVNPLTGEVHSGTSPLEEFDAYRFVGTNIKSTTVGLEHMAFGLGAHACPGRFFAANEIKYVVAVMIMRYNIRTRSGKRAKDNVMLGMTRFPPAEPLIIERRLQ
ncbi:cytochrome P450 [Mycotypha africana]|uniref:cytochrome P450 n=1 Tax=Mycotypha africana TaxID=64632 RepID=UPI002300EB2C|nr:cytochrome P450 [Mycotypha africana]KAI8971454.1 cytochrome P450 [Mycotypha africana]